MRPLRYSINAALDGCSDHPAILPDEERHRHAAGIIGQADALLFGRVTYERMESAWRKPGYGPTLLAGLSKHADLQPLTRLECRAQERLKLHPNEFRNPVRTTRFPSTRNS